MDAEKQALFGGFHGPIKASGVPQDAILGPNLPTINSGPITIKPGVVFKVLRPEIYSQFSVISRIFHAIGKDCVITSANDSTHKEGSKHYQDLAIDLRSKHLVDSFQKHTILKELKDKLGSKYIVLLEFEGGQNEHFHAGWGG